MYRLPADAPVAHIVEPEGQSLSAEQIGRMLEGQLARHCVPSGPVELPPAPQQTIPGQSCCVMHVTALPVPHVVGFEHEVCAPEDDVLIAQHF